VANQESISRTFIVAILLCLVCGVFVAAAAVSLKPEQERNAEQNLQRNVLAAAGVYDAAKSIDEQWASVQVRYVDINAGEFVDAPATYNLNKILKDSSQTTVIDSSSKLGIAVRENIAKAYVFEKEGEIDLIVLPLRGKGLWSTMWGFIALSSDFNTVVGFTFYEHGETPGLGGEVDNPRWKAQWPGKELYDTNGDLVLRVTKAGQASETNDIDGLSGATLTTNGIEYTVRYWLGENGYEPLLANLKAGEA